MKFENPFKKSAPKSEEASSPNSLNRREFLGFAAALGAGAAVGGITFKAAEEIKDITDGKTLDDYQRDISEIFNETELTEKILTLKEAIKERYGVHIILEQDELEQTSVVKYSHSDAELRLTKQIEALDILTEELQRYPDFMIRQYGLETIAITTPSSDPQNNVGGYQLPGHIDSQIPSLRPELVLHYDWNAEYSVPENKRLLEKDYPDRTPEMLALVRQMMRRSYFKSIIHHELVHFMIDENGTEWSPRHAENRLAERWDEEFKSTNSQLRDFYRKTNPAITSNNTKDADYNLLNYDAAGVAHGYGLKNEQEDRATIMESMMLTGPNKTRLEKDILLQKKTELIKEYYLDASCGLMNEDYWAIFAPYGFPRNTQEFFAIRAYNIINTPFEYSDYKDQVSEEKYLEWQNRLRHTNLVKNDVGTK